MRCLVLILPNTNQHEAIPVNTSRCLTSLKVIFNNLIQKESTQLNTNQQETARRYAYLRSTVSPKGHNCYTR